MRWGALLGFLATVPAANWMIGHVGTVCLPAGPCLIPVAPGVMAPSGVLMVGLAFTLRDVVQRMLGSVWCVAAILLGGALSGLVAPPALAAASVSAFLLSELADWAVYTPLQRRGLIVAVVASNLVGLTIDSLLFTWMAFGAVDHAVGNAIGKAWMTAAVLPVLFWVRSMTTLSATRAREGDRLVVGQRTLAPSTAVRTRLPQPPKREDRL